MTLFAKIHEKENEVLINAENGSVALEFPDAKVADHVVKALKVYFSKAYGGIMTNGIHTATSFAFFSSVNINKEISQEMLTRFFEGEWTPKELDAILLGYVFLNGR